MARTTRASLELKRDENGKPLWLDWLASGNPALRDGNNKPVISFIAKATGLPDKTLYGLADGSRTPKLSTVGEIVAAGAHLNGVSDDVAMQHIVHMVHYPITEAEAA